MGGLNCKKTRSRWMIYCETLLKVCHFATCFEQYRNKKEKIWQEIQIRGDNNIAYTFHETGVTTVDMRHGMGSEHEPDAKLKISLIFKS